MSWFHTDWQTVLTIVGLTVVTVFTRSFFLLSNKPWQMPTWFERGLHYAPIAALAAVVAPEILMTNGHLITTWQDARIFAAAAGLACYYWRRDVLWAIIGGMVVFLPLHLGLGW